MRQPQRGAGLLLTNAISYDSWPIPSVTTMRKLGPALHRLPDAPVKSFLQLFFQRGHDDPDRARQALEVYWPSYAQHGAADALARQVRSLRTKDALAVADRLSALDVPARIVWGKHWVPEDHPDAIAAGLKDLLAAV